MARVRDVTDEKLREVAETLAPGEHSKRAQRAAPARELTPSLATFLERWKRPSDKTIGYVSKPLAYARAVTGERPSHHTNMLRLIKGGHIRVCEVAGKPPAGSRAHTESPYGERFYVLAAGSCPTEIDPAATTFSGRRRR